MSSRYERGAGVLLPFFVGYTISNIVFAVVASASHETPSDRVHDVQIKNEQVQTDLERSHRVGQLVLNDTDRTFSFVTEATDGTPETCTGKYVEANGSAHVDGDLACTQTVPAAPHS